MSRFLALLLTLSLSLYLPAQDHPFFAFANAPGAQFAPKPVTNYKYEVAKRVYDDLVRARGDRYKPVPTFVMNAGRQYMAWMNPVKTEIGLEEKVYDLCVRFGADSLNAIATLLAHELTHYYENHDWSRSFVNHNEALDAGRKIAQQPLGIQYETEADAQGGMLAIAAGYNVYGLMPEFLARAYEDYGLPEEIRGYPSLEDRIGISRNAVGQLQELHAIYRTANMLTLINAYEPALAYYEKVMATFQSYEVYNNAAVCALLAVLDLMEPGEFPYALPLELDATSRLDKLATRLPDDPDARRRVLLEKAGRYLENATSLTDREAVAPLNLAVYYLLAEEYEDAEYWAGKAQRMAVKGRQGKTGADAQIVLGILADQRDDRAGAERLFTAAKTKSPSLAALNLAAIKGGKMATVAARTAKPGGRERIGETDLDNLFYALPELDVNVEVAEKVYCGKKAYDDHTLLLHFADDGEEYAAFQVTDLDFTGSSQLGISLGAQLSEVTEVYGPADKTLAVRTGDYLRYDEQRIIFCFDADGRLERWILYTKNL